MNFRNFIKSKPNKFWALFSGSIILFWLSLLHFGYNESHSPYRFSILLSAFSLSMIGVFIFIYTIFDELQKRLVILALALSALLTLTIKLSYGFFAFVNKSLPQFTGEWMTVCLIFSFLILVVIFFFKNDDDVYQ